MLHDDDETLVTAGARSGDEPGPPWPTAPTTTTSGTTGGAPASNGAGASAEPGEHAVFDGQPASGPRVEGEAIAGGTTRGAPASTKPLEHATASEQGKGNSNPIGREEHLRAHTGGARPGQRRLYVTLDERPAAGPPAKGEVTTVGTTPAGSEPGEHGGGEPAEHGGGESAEHGGCEPAEHGGCEPGEHGGGEPGKAPP